MRPAALLAIALLAGCVGSPAATFAGQVVTLADLAHGTQPSGDDKQGHGGITVLVHNVTVHKVVHEDDGDWHLASSDPTYAPFILEIIPRDQGNVSQPPLDVPLAVLGVPYCDRAHAGEAWHGNVCWELHPLLNWQREP